MMSLSSSSTSFPLAQCSPCTLVCLPSLKQISLGFSLRHLYWLFLLLVNSSLNTCPSNSFISAKSVKKKRERKKLIRLHYRLGTLKLENLNPLYQQQVCPKLSLDGDVIYIILDNNKVDIYSEEGQYLHLPRLFIIKHP